MPRREFEFLTPAETARARQCHPKTVVRHVNAGRISAARTIGGHRRIRAASVREALLEGGMTAAEVDARLEWACR